MAGNYVIAHSSQLLASLRNDEATKIISRIIDDLIHGELCQLESVCSTHHARYEQDRVHLFNPLQPPEISLKGFTVESV